MLPISSKDLELQLRVLRLTGHGPPKAFIAGAGEFAADSFTEQVFAASLPLPTLVTGVAANNEMASTLPYRFAACQNGKFPHGHEGTYTNTSIIMLPQSLSNLLVK